MKDLFLIPIMLAVFVFGYFVMAKIDSFIEENRRLIHAENRQNRAHIRIAAESPMLLDSIAVQLTAYSRANPFVEFFLSSGKAERILQKLMDGTLDIAILAEENNLSVGQLQFKRASFGIAVQNLVAVKWHSAVKVHRVDLLRRIDEQVVRRCILVGYSLMSFGNRNFKFAKLDSLSHHSHHLLCKSLSPCKRVFTF